MKKQLYQRAFVQYGTAKPKETFLTTQTVEELEKPKTEEGKKAARERMNITKIEPEYYELAETTGNDGSPATEYVVTNETPESIANEKPATKKTATGSEPAKRGPKAKTETVTPATSKTAATDGESKSKVATGSETETGKSNETPAE